MGTKSTLVAVETRFEINKTCIHDPPAREVRLRLCFMRGKQHYDYELLIELRTGGWGYAMDPDSKSGGEVALSLHEMEWTL